MQGKKCKAGPKSERSCAGCHGSRDGFSLRPSLCPGSGLEGGVNMVVILIGCSILRKCIDHSVGEKCFCSVLCRDGWLFDGEMYDLSLYQWFNATVY